MEVISRVPVYMGVSKQEISKDMEFDQIWGMCRKCSCIQLTRMLPQELLYEINHHQEVVGEIWRNHHHEFASFIQESRPKKITEIGGAHGYLAELITRNHPSIEYTIVEPDSNLESEKIRVISGFIEDNLEELKGSDTIVHSHVLEHVYNPVKFFLDVANSMDMSSVLIFSIPNMPELIRLGGMNALNFEHTYLLVVEQVEVIAQALGLEFEEKRDYKSHSIFFRFRKSRTVEPEALYRLRELIPDVREHSLNFINSISQARQFVDLMNKRMDAIPGDVYIFGAHVFSQALFSLGLDRKRIVGVLDNAKSKQGLRLYGTNLLVSSPENGLRDKTNPAVIVRASHYQAEIIEQLKEINSSVTVLQS